MNWLLETEAAQIEPVLTELSVEPVRADALYYLPEQQKILHLEFQTVPKSTPALPLRMLDYWVRLYRQYGCPIEQVVIFLKQTTSPSVYIDRFNVGETVHPYRVIRLWEQAPEPLLANVALLPLAVLARSEAPEVLLSQVAERIDMIEESEQQRNISACAQVLASLRYEQRLIQQFLREELMREAPLYQEILQEGRQQEAQTIVLRLLTRRFGVVEPRLTARIQQLSSSQIEELAEALLDFSTLNDLEDWLEAHQT